MSNHTPKTESDWRKTLTHPPGVAERFRERLPEIEQAMAFLRDFDPFRRPEIPLPPFARQPAELHAVQASAEPAATSEATVGRGQISWQTARDRLVAIRRQGESFTSLRDLADRVGCSEGLIRKAIKQDVGLRAWTAESKRTRRTAPAATGLERAIHRTPQRREEAPELAAVEAEEADDTDVLLQRLIDAASPAERARLHAMPEEQRMSILRLMRDQDEDRDARRLRKRA
jgi:hypothetical protein